ncbi:helix-turn-helix domain-containing protein [Kribbella albertanoniae]|uniref:XRE family transcriptional regulator n=1 Tax=Kribbella albertanoniae TaxID=1266829 RepID=A0A4R4Q9Y9_9ACTN|nr:helix-turn-helix transcriptional regulator [Kribbella albertanoniae]TDC32107.1 XRE family transcriptional regulator [Kribbella albertanoniae]
MSNLRELGEFLKARRAELTPRDVGLPETRQRRRVPGLRREEVALLGAISTTHYTRLEQGRVAVTGPVLGTLAQVLRLTVAQRNQLFELAGNEVFQRRYRRARQIVQPHLQRLLNELPAIPAFVLGRRTDILAWNAMAAALVTDFGSIPPKHRSYVRLLFTDPAMRTLYPDWENVARRAVAQLRTEAAGTPGDPRMSTLVGELSTRDEQFRTWWGTDAVPGRGVGAKNLNHPLVGALTLEWDTLTSAADPEQHLIVWTAEPGSPSDDSLRVLASWTAGAFTPEGDP